MTDEKKPLPPEYIAQQFKPGQSGNPGGKAKVPEDVKKALALTKNEFVRILSKLIFMNTKELKEYLSRPETTVLELMLGRIIERVGKDGEPRRAELLLDRLIGKPVQGLLLANVNPPQVIIRMPDNGRDKPPIEVKGEDVRPDHD